MRGLKTKPHDAQPNGSDHDLMAKAKARTLQFRRICVNELGSRHARFESHFSKERLHTNIHALCSLIFATVSHLYEAFACCDAHCSRARGHADLDFPQLRPPARPFASRRPAGPSTNSSASSRGGTRRFDRLSPWRRGKPCGPLVCCRNEQCCRFAEGGRLAGRAAAETRLGPAVPAGPPQRRRRSEEHTSELQSLAY